MEKYKILSIEIDGKVYDLREKLEPIALPEEKPDVKNNIEYKKCSRCRQEKTIDHFNIDNSQKDGYQGWCKDCKNEYAKSYKKILNKRNKKRLYMQEYNKRKKAICLTQIVTEKQMEKPEIGTVDGTKLDALPVTPQSDTDERVSDSVVNDPEKRKRFHWGV